MRLDGFRAHAFGMPRNDELKDVASLTLVATVHDLHGLTARSANGHIAKHSAVVPANAGTHTAESLLSPCG
ncbi:hypothetical protein BRAS3843_2470046 [Bradyrhizobium sp. STM 3843]|nr:hypothetical protein BRAS3843_2470046 [Bradyrhizobium sp. STM 3843]